jgi:hypothetical protein
MSVKFIATVAGVNGPVAENEKQAISRLREYMESHLGKRHFHDANPDSKEQDYQNTLFKLYGKEEGEDFEASFGGTSETDIKPDISVSNLD